MFAVGSELRNWDDNLERKHCGKSSLRAISLFPTVFSEDDT